MAEVQKELGNLDTFYALSVRVLPTLSHQFITQDRCLYSVSGICLILGTSVHLGSRHVHG